MIFSDLNALDRIKLNTLCSRKMHRHVFLPKITGKIDVNLIPQRLIETLIQQPESWNIPDKLFLSL